MSSDNDSKRCRKSRRCENCYFYHKENDEEGICEDCGGFYF